MPLWLFDALLAGGLVLLAWQSLHAADLFKAVVLFIAFGLLMALAWVRLDAVDIALAEAAIGAGLTGALLLDALGHIAGKPREAGISGVDSPDGAPVEQVLDPQEDGFALGGRGRAALGALVLAGTVGLGAAVWHLPGDDPGLRDAVAGALAAHPVGNPATAVLIDFRAYDTFLEMGVLALAAMGALLLTARRLRVARAEAPARGSVILDVLTRLLVPLMLVIAGYLLWSGTAGSGGAFPAGAILGAAGVLLFLADIGRRCVADGPAARLVLALGLLVFLVAGALTLIGGRRFLDFGEDWTYAAILAIEIVLTLSIGGTLALLYGASAKLPPEEGEAGQPAREPEAPEIEPPAAPLPRSGGAR
jgi:multisubunit Na+/H+ antiporter MnhB subunit